MNRVILCGTLEADPETRNTGRSQVTNLRVKTTEEYTHNGERKTKHEFHRVVVWGARSVLSDLRKGSTVLVEGSNRTSSYDNRDGQKVWKTEVQASNVTCIQAAAPEPDEELPDAGGFGDEPPEDSEIPF